MVFYEDKFIVNGIESSSKNIILVDSTSKEVLMDYNMIHQFGIDGDTTYGGRINYLPKEEKPDTVTLEFCLINEYGQPEIWTEEKREEILNWLAEKKFNEFISYDNKELKYYFYPVKITTKMNHEKRGIISIEYQPFSSYPIKTITKSISLTDNETISIDTEKLKDKFIYPLIKIRANADGDVSIINKSTTLSDEKKMIIKDLKNGEEIIVDNYSYIVTDNNNNNKFYKVNRNWIKLKEGVNNIYLTGNASIEFILNVEVNI